MNKVLENDFALVYKHLKNDLEHIAGHTVLIAGASGMMGHYLGCFLSWLNSHYHFAIELHGLVRTKKDTDIPGMTYHVGDVSDYNFKQLKFDHIIHAASFSSPLHFTSHPIETAVPNVVGTVNLLTQAEKMRLKSFVFISASDVYGDLGLNKSGITEDEFGVINPMLNKSSFAESKRMGESLCLSWYKQKHIPIKVVRMFNVYGPGISRSDGREHNEFIYSVVDKKDIVVNDGSSRRSFCYISDAIEGVLMTMIHGLKGEAYNLGNADQEMMTREAAEIAVGAIPSKNLKVIEGDLFSNRITRSTPDVSKLKSLGWNPRVELEDGIRRTVQYIESRES